MDYGRMDMVNGNYMGRKQPEDGGRGQRRKRREERRRAEELRMEEQRLEEERRTAVMRREFSFFGWASAVYALFIHSACIKCIGDPPTLFSSQEPLSILAYVPEGQGSIEKDSTFTVVSMLLLGVSVFLTDNLRHTAHLQKQDFSSRHQPDASSVFR